MNKLVTFMILSLDDKTLYSVSDIVDNSNETRTFQEHWKGKEEKARRYSRNMLQYLRKKQTTPEGYTRTKGRAASPAWFGFTWKKLLVNTG